MITGKALPRRTFLRGVRTTIALPFLDAMTPAFAAPSQPATRAAFLYTAKTLAPVEPFRDDLLVLTGLALPSLEIGDSTGKIGHLSEL